MVVLGVVELENDPDHVALDLGMNFIDTSPFYKNPVAKDARSWMNVPFTLARPELDKTFLAEAKDAGLVTLEGHRSVGGMRASLYNAMPLAGVQALVDLILLVVI